MSLRLVVTGGRNFSSAAIVWHALSSLHETYTIGALIQGGATGADSLCASWARENGVETIDMPANWSDVTVDGAVIRYRRDGTPYNVLAGFNRNQSMIDIGQPNYGIAFAGGRGTADMCKRITDARIPLWDLRGIGV